MSRNFSRIERCYCLATAILFDLLKLPIVYEQPKPPTPEEVNQKIEDFKEMTG